MYTSDLQAFLAPTFERMSLRQFDVARAHLSDYWIKQAKYLKSLTGMGYVEVPEDIAPSTPEALREAFHAWSNGLKPFPVLADHSDTTVYTTKEANWSFRFCHDIAHAKLGAGFDGVGERVVIINQADALAKVFGRYSDEMAVFAADTLGQLIYGEEHNGEFVVDQKAFAISLLVVKE